MIYGVNNPRSTQPTGVFIISTFDKDGISEIDSGFRIQTQMTTAAPIDSFSVQPGSVVNGEVSDYTFTISTRVTIIDGDVLTFVFPEQIRLPRTVEELNITPLPRIVNGVEVLDELQVEISGSKIIITFVKVAPTTQTYKWTLSNIANPPSEQTSGAFSDVISVDAQGYLVQQFYGVGPRITNT